MRGWTSSAACARLLTRRLRPWRKTVLERTGLVVYPLNHDAAHALAVSATASLEWCKQKTRDNLSGRALVAQLRSDGHVDIADLIAEQDAACLFSYYEDAWLDVHFDKSKEAERWMARLTETPEKIHVLMIQGSDDIVYKVTMTGSFVYFGELGTDVSPQ